MARLVAIVACLSLAVASAFAQNAPMPKDRFTTSPGGVDLRSGSYVMDATEFVIGDPDVGGFAFKRTSGNATFLSTDKIGQFSHNWIVFATQSASKNDSGNYTQTVSAEGLSTTFLGYNDVPGFPPFYQQASSGPVTTLESTKVGTTFYFTHTSPGGRVITFRTMGGSEVGVASHKSAYASQITYPNGVVYTFNYNATPDLASVVSNAGYALVFEYTTVNSKVLVSKVCGIDLANRTLPSTCPAGVPTVSYTYGAAPFGARLASVTDVSGNVSTITYAQINGGLNETESFYKPGASQPWLVNYYRGNPSTDPNSQAMIYRQSFADGAQYDYAWSGMAWGANYENYSVFGTGYTVNGTATTSVSYSTYWNSSFPDQAPIFSTGPEQVTDPLGRVSSFYYCVSCARQQLYWQSLPEGMKATSTYDGAGNVTSTTAAPNTGSGLSSLVTSSTYDCSAPVNCGKPITATDARGAVTTYAYSAIHGGLLLEMKPAVGGVSPATRYGYAQLYAWTKAPGSGFVQANPPIWRRAEERTCRTSATVGNACASGPSDEVVTTYEYEAGNASSPSNFRLKGKVVTADGVSLRTCYGYDAWGRKIWETLPRAGLSSCS